jgi:hypothetical protein
VCGGRTAAARSGSCTMEEPRLIEDNTLCPARPGPARRCALSSHSFSGPKDPYAVSIHLDPTNEFKGPQSGS